jgi:hypothetical protein
MWLTSQVRISPGVPDRCKLVGAEPFSQSGKSFGCTPPNLMSIRSRRTSEINFHPVRKPPGITGCATKDAPIGLGNTKSLEHQAK